ncbi:MAG: 50S ribosomal protein L10 [Ignavibacteria bacterium]|nr:50S ribosomal protein L10 [Ignavibacteria bacterium]MCC7159327.1 50S ribosomal protein L10 [Ignavibacteria bacterium]
MNKQDKEQAVLEIKEKLDNAAGIYLTDFSGLTVAQTNELRDELFNAKVEYKVLKNTLVKKALEQCNNRFSAQNEKISEFLKGPTGIIFASDADPVTPAKIIKKFFDKGEKPKLKLALVEDVAYESKQLNQLASLPTKLEIISSIVGSLHAPISGIVGSINALMRDLASVVEEVAKKKAS